MKLTTLLLACALALGSFEGRADDRPMEAAGRKVFETHANSVVIVNAVVKVVIYNDAQAKVGEQDKKNEVLATVIDPSGLTICSLAAIDPTTAVSSIRANVDGQPQKLTVKGELSEIKYRLATGEEIDARVVLKDEDLDMAFLAPKKPLDGALAEKMVPVNLADADKSIQLLDPVIFISRLGKNLGYEPALITGRITAKLTKPRIEYLAGGQPGTPAFNREGKLVGIVLTHRRTDSETPASGEVVQTAVLIPAADLLDPAKQAIEELAKKSEK